MITMNTKESIVDWGILLSTIITICVVIVYIAGWVSAYISYYLYANNPLNKKEQDVDIVWHCFVCIVLSTFYTKL